MLLNIAPDADGLVPDEAMALYTQFGKWVQSCYGNPPAIVAKPPNGPSVVLPIPSSLGAIDRVVAMEDQSAGEQVLAYTLEVQNSAGQWSVVGQGQAIGHKRIHLLGKSIYKVKALRLNATAMADVDPAGIKWVSLAAIDGVLAGC